MQRAIPYLFIVAVVTFFAACGQMAPAELPPAELIVGKWNFERLDIAKEKYDQVEDSEVAEFALLQAQMKVMQYSFHKDGTYSMDAALTKDRVKNLERGTYRLINDGTVLVTEPLNSESEQGKTEELDVVRITEDSLILGKKLGEGAIVYLRSK